MEIIVDKDIVPQFYKLLAELGKDMAEISSELKTVVRQMEQATKDHDEITTLRVRLEEQEKQAAQIRWALGIIAGVIISLTGLFATHMSWK